MLCPGTTAKQPGARSSGARCQRKDVDDVVFVALLMLLSATITGAVLLWGWRTQSAH
jgi:hypothetical protein